MQNTEDYKVVYVKIRKVGEERGMSAEQVRVARLLLQEGFGDLVKSVGSYMMNHGACQLTDVIRGTKLKPNQVCLQHKYYIHSCSYETWNNVIQHCVCVFR